MALRAHGSHQRAWLLKAGKLRTGKSTYVAWHLMHCVLEIHVSVSIWFDCSLQDAPCQVQHDKVERVSCQTQVITEVKSYAARGCQSFV